MVAKSGHICRVWAGSTVTITERLCKLISRAGLPSECHWPLDSFYSGGLPQAVFLEGVPSRIPKPGVSSEFHLGGAS